MLDAVKERTFVEVAEVWVPEGDTLVWAGGDYGDLAAFEAVSGKETFNKGEGLPGKAWAEARPVVLKAFEGSYFKRTEAAHASGLSAAIAMPIFAGDTLRAVLVTFFGADEDRIGAIEVWAEMNGVLKLDDGYYGAARHFEWVSRHTQFPRGQGMPGLAWSTAAPVLMRDLGSGYKFIRAETAGSAGLTTGVGLPVPVPGDATYIFSLLSARGTPIARRFETWSGEGALLDGICAEEGDLSAGLAPTPAVTEALKTGIPVAQGNAVGLPAGYTSVVAVPIHVGGGVDHVIAWYN
ncbi:MAG: GAF domain-containing protein [Pseudomonadota bacterium]